jgi:hypothetical protein
MHRAFAAWLIGRPWRAAVATAFCGALSQQMMLPFVVLAGAIPVLMLSRYDLRVALGIALSGAAAVTWIVLSASAANIWVFLGIAWLFFGPVSLGVILRRSGSLNLSFQVAVLFVALVVTLIHVLLPDPVALWVPLLRPIVEQMIASGLQLGSDAETLVQLWARTMWGALAALSLGPVLGALFLGRWWESLLSAPGAFGREYQQLRLGMVLGALVTVTFVMTFVSDAALLSSLAWVGFAGLVFQGLAAAHRSKARGTLNRGWLAAIYVLLIVPLSMSVTVFVLALWGFADNWLRPKAPRAA